MAEESRRLAIRAASAPGRAVVRLTGGARGLSADAAAVMEEIFMQAFAGCDITVMAGGTRMISRLNGLILPGITEVLPLIRSMSPLAKTVGVIPQQTDLLLRDGKLVVSDKPANDHYTIVHPDLDTCLLLQYSVDKALQDWDAEWMSALDLMDALRIDADYRSLHVVYGGGETTERELRHVVQLPGSRDKPWHVVLVANSGGVAARYAADTDFCTQFANRLTVCRAHDLAATLQSLGFTRPQSERRT